MNSMARDVATRTDNQVKMAVIDADVNPLLFNAFSGDSNPMLWIVKPDGNKVDQSSQGSQDLYLTVTRNFLPVDSQTLTLKGLFGLFN